MKHGGHVNGYGKLYVIQYFIWPLTGRCSATVCFYEILAVYKFAHSSQF